MGGSGALVGKFSGAKGGLELVLSIEADDDARDVAVDHRAIGKQKP